MKVLSTDGLTKLIELIKNGFISVDDTVTTSTTTLATVATSGSYNDLSNKPTIPSEVTESTVSGWGFTKNVGTVTKVNNVSPVNGNVTLSIPTVPTNVSAFTNDAGYAKSSDLADVATSGSYEDLSDKPTIPAEQVNADWNATSGKAQILNKPTIPSVGNAEIEIQKNGTKVDSFTTNQSGNKKTINITVPTTASDVNALPSSTKYGATIDVTLSTTDYKQTITLKDQDGNTLNSKTVDFPVESMVVSGTFDSTNKKIILTLQNGNTTDIPVGDLISGLQTEITSTNKLSADLIADGTTNKLVTASEKSTWNNKQNALTTTQINNIAKGGTALQPNDNVSELNNDAGYITGINSSDVTTALGYTPYNSSNPSGYQANKIETIKVNGTAQTITNKAVDISVPTNNNQLTNGAGYITSNALAPYALSTDLATVATSGSYNDLSDKPTIPAAQVNSDWNATSGVAQILNKPTIPTVVDTYSSTGTDAISGKGVKAALDTLSIPSKISDLTDDTATYPVDKADTLTGLTATVTELNYVDGVTSAIQTQLNEKVSKSGDTMTGPLAFQASDGSPIQIQSSDIVKGIAPESNHYKNIMWVDSNNNELGRLQYRYLSSGSTGVSLTIPSLTDPQTYDGIYIISLPDGTFATQAPTPSSGDNSTKIATTAFVNTDFVKKSGGTMSGDLVNNATFKKNGTFPTSTPSSNTHLVGYEIHGNSNRIGLLGSGYLADGDTCTYIQHERVVGGTTKYAAIQLGIDPDGIACFTFPRCTTKATTTSSASSKRVAVVVQNYVNGTSWYRVWSDGWIEQGGSGNYNNGGAIVFAKTFANTNYSIQVSPRGLPTNATSDNNWLAFPLTKSKNQCTVRLIDSDGADGRNGAIEWMACGY